MTHPAIFWFRKDLRLSDNPALNAAVESGKPLILLYILDETSDGIRPLGGAAKWWLHFSLEELGKSIEDLGGKLLLRKGKAQEILEELQERSGADTIFWNRRYDKGERDIDAAVKTHFEDKNVTCKSFNGSLLIEPWKVTKNDGSWYQVFTPFWRQAQEVMDRRDLYPKPKKLNSFDMGLKTDSLEDWGLLPTKPNWATGLAEMWTPGEVAAEKRLEDFIEDGLKGYAEGRDRPDLDSTSRLSPYLAHGNISPNQIWHRVERLKVEGHPSSEKDKTKFIAEVGWREFSYNLLFHFPDLGRKNFKDKFDDFPWEKNDAALTAWQKGKTGYPIVDAGMRQLWQTGWMHNRVRMIVASFLIKDLMIDWREGEAWFWDTLVDADVASNTASWQWVAGSGADAAPYFRIFNPTTQGQKHDPKGDFVRTYVNELEKLRDEAVHEPAIINKDKLAAAGIALGKTYPRPIVDHKKARESALAAFEKLKNESNV